jgi:hypothetical protein
MRNTGVTFGIIDDHRHMLSAIITGAKNVKYDRYSEKKKRAKFEKLTLPQYGKGFL